MSASVRLSYSPPLRLAYLFLVIRASFNSGAGQAGLRRQDAGANSESGPKGTPRERRVIQCLPTLNKALGPGLTSFAVECRRDDGRQKFQPVALSVGLKGRGRRA